jgi:hypothetical protein
MGMQLRVGASIYAWPRGKVTERSAYDIGADDSLSIAF